MSVFDGIIYLIAGGAVIFSVMMTLAFIGCQKEIRDLKRLLLKKTLADVKEKRQLENAREGLN